LAECAVLLLARNPAVSTWSVLLACVYPVWETVFSMFRRQVISRASSGEADQVHLHHVMLSRLRGNRSLNINSRPSWKSHSLVSISIWAMVAGCQFIALTVGANTAVLACGIILFAGIYCWIYQALSSGANLQTQSIQAAKM
jgi:UDP-GlcNAc:undecaprenyl-phosphate GlcNAc-1-phosphate transferase